MLIISSFFISFILKKNDMTQSIEIYDAFDTYSEITVISDKDAEDILIKCRDYLKEKDMRWSVTKPESEISALNYNAGKCPVSLSPDTIDILEKSLEYSSLTNGAFDITIRPICDIWDNAEKTGIIPTENEIKTVLPDIGYKYLSVNPQKLSAELKKSSAGVLLGAIAKGYATDEIRDILKKSDIDSALINLGGNIYAMGTQKNGTPWNIAIQDPKNSNGILGTLHVSDKAIVTSGSYIRYFENNGNIYHHIIDPKSGYPAKSGLLSVTIISSDATLADAISTSCFVMGFYESLALLDKTNVSGIFVTDDKKVYYSDNLENSFSHNNPEYQYILF